MQVCLTDTDDDFGTLEIQLGPDDSFHLDTSGDQITIRLPLYAHEASELCAVLEPLAGA